MNTGSAKYMQVIENIHEELMTNELSENIGLHAGSSGIALFVAYYHRIVRRMNKISPRVMENFLTINKEAYVKCSEIQIPDVFSKPMSDASLDRRFRVSYFLVFIPLKTKYYGTEKSQKISD